MMDVRGLCLSLRIGGYKRIGIQVSDRQLATAPLLVDKLQAELPEAIVCLLGDSVTECCLDEIAAEHYGCDCIVKLGHTCWFASQRLAAYFVTEPDCETPQRLFDEFQRLQQSCEDSVVIFPDSVCDMEIILRNVPPTSVLATYVCVGECMSYPGSEYSGMALSLFYKMYVSKGLFPIYRKAVDCGIIAIPRIGGRLVFKLVGTGHLIQVRDLAEVASVLNSPTTKFLVCVGNSSDSSESSPLLNRLVNRFGTSKGRVVPVLPSTESVLVDERAFSNYSELLRRYRGVEAVRMASVVGIVVSHCSACVELFRVRDLLSEFLRLSGKEVHMFSMTKFEGVKFGNFPDIECYITMACPESNFFESDDLSADWATAYEALVALELLDWSDHIITDYDEMLNRMRPDLPPRTPRTPRRRADLSSACSGDYQIEQPLPPARIEPGLRGIPSRYVSEPPSNS